MQRWLKKGEREIHKEIETSGVYIPKRSHPRKERAEIVECDVCGKKIRRGDENT